MIGADEPEESLARRSLNASRHCRRRRSIGSLRSGAIGIPETINLAETSPTRTNGFLNWEFRIVVG